MWKSVSCEIQGRGHIDTHTPCQDKTKQLSINDVNVIALADGAGSSSFSEHGAQCIVDTACNFVANNFQNIIENPDGKQIKQLIIEVLLLALTNKAADLKCSLNDMASTFLLVATYKDQYLIMHIGDGIIGYLDGEKLRIASYPDNGEFSNETTFVTSKNAIISMRLFKGKINNISGFILMSDGTGQSLYHKATKTLVEANIKLMHRTCLVSKEVMHSQLSDTLSSLIATKTRDDCSIAILARPFGILSPIEDLDFYTRCELFRICLPSKRVQKKVARYDKIYSFLLKPHTPVQIARKIHVKPKYTRKYLRKLLSYGLIVKQGNLYSRC